MLAPPPTEFAQRGGGHLAYQVAGEGPLEIVFVGGASAPTLLWEQAAFSRAFRRMATFARLITYDQRGMGYSDPVDPANPPSFDDLVSDLDAVIAAAGATRPVLFGHHNGGAVAAAYAAAHPVTKLVLANTWARLEWAADYPIGIGAGALDQLEDLYRRAWGQGLISDQFAAPQSDLAAHRVELASTSRNQAVVLYQMNRRYDIRDRLGQVRVPTLVLHSEGNRSVPPALGKFVADSIPDAEFVLLPSSDQNLFRHHADAVIDRIESFTTGTIRPFVDRVTPTMLFTDIVGSTAMAAALGDEGWSSLIEQHNRRVRRCIRAREGDEAKCTGDGFLVVFDEPEQAIRCAFDAIEAVVELGLELRAGVHVGDVIRMDQRDLAGLDVHLAQRLCAQAGGGQVLTSGAAKERCGGGPVSFAALGTAILKGIPGEQEIFAAQL